MGKIELSPEKRQRRKVHNATYRAKNSAKVKECQSKWRSENKDKIKADRAKYYQENKDRENTTNNEYWKDPDNKARRNENPAYRLRVFAKNQVNSSIRSGKLTRDPCEVCGDPKSEGHHDDYSKPLDVRWLCHTHHVEHHRAQE